MSNDDLLDALDHIMRVAQRSRTQSKRDRWIAYRAYCAIHGKDDWENEDVPKMPMSDDERLGQIVRAYMEQADEVPMDDAVRIMADMVRDLYEQWKEEAENE